jgi:PEP-CTERM motif
MKRFASLAVVACLWAWTGTARADIIVYSTFGEPGDTFTNGGAFLVYGSASGGYVAPAMEFTPSASVTLDKIRFAFTTPNTGYTNDVILAANSSGAPGSALETLSAISTTNTGGLFNGTILTENSVVHPGLVAGQNYWLVLQPHDPTTSDVGGWLISNPPVSGTSAARVTPNGAWSVATSQTQAAFEIDGVSASATPEPASLVLCGVGVLGLLGYGWRRKRAAA